MFHSANVTMYRSKRRSCACSTTTGVYGGHEGTAFVDVTTNACDVDITDIWIRHGDIIHAIQVQYMALQKKGPSVEAEEVGLHT